jgi:hypothetical protein
MSESDEGMLWCGDGEAGEAAPAWSDDETLFVESVAVDVGLVTVFGEEDDENGETVCAVSLDFTSRPEWEVAGDAPEQHRFVIPIDLARALLGDLQRAIRPS